MSRGPEENGVRQNARHGWTSCRILQSFLERHLFFLISALNNAFDSGCLSVTQRRGVIKLIPKKDAERYLETY